MQVLLPHDHNEDEYSQGNPIIEENEVSNENEKRQYYPYIVVALGVLLIIVSLFLDASDEVGVPDQWLIQWTDWAAKYVAIAVAAISVLKVADGTQKLLGNWHLRNKE